VPPPRRLTGAGAARDQPTCAATAAAGVLRVPVAILHLTGVLAALGPSWYVVFQGLLGVVQFAIGLVMVAGYRRAGVWGTA
jgi:hypothetical protein